MIAGPMSESLTYPAAVSAPSAVHPVPPPALSPWVVYPTAFLEGASVIITEIAGARALAPFFGTSLQVWTALITVTLLFLALGYGLGGLMAKRLGGWMLPALFAAAGAWLVMYPLMRTPMLEFASRNLGVALGSLFSAALVFGLPLLMLGAVSPVLIALIDRRRPGAGSAAGRLFFTNTMGGLVGGWVTAFVLIPHTSLRMSLVATGIGLLVLALLWFALSRGTAMTLVSAVLVVAGVSMLFVKPNTVHRDKHGQPFDLLYSRQSGIGLLQVLDLHTIRHDGRMLLINGVLQGEMNVDTGRALIVDERLDYIHNLHLMCYSHHPQAKTALQLGLGAGLLPKELARRGVKVTAVEIEPQIARLSRELFQLPESVDVVISDARTYLRNNQTKYDLILLDTFASESTAWYLLTREAFTEMRERLNPGGRLVINTVAYAGEDKPGLSRIEASLLAAFPEALCYPEPALAGSDDPEDLINVTLVAGENLRAAMAVPDETYTVRSLARLVANERAAVADEPPTTDDRSDLDYAQAPLRIKWRTLIWNSLDSSLLWD